MMLFSIFLIALLGKVEPFKLSLKPTSGPPPAEAPLLPIEQQHVYRQPELPSPGYMYGREHHLTIGPMTHQYPQESLAFLLVKPMQQYQYLPPQRYMPLMVPAPLPQPASVQRPRADVKGESIIQQQEELVPIQQQREELPIQQQREELPIQQQEQIREEDVQRPEGPPPPAPAILIPLTPKKQAKLVKLKESIDKLAAHAMSKLTLGSTYHVVHEEYITPAPQAHLDLQGKTNLEQHEDRIPIQQEPIRPLEQQRLEEPLPQQQIAESFDDTKRPQQQLETLPEREPERAPVKGQLPERLPETSLPLAKGQERPLLEQHLLPIKSQERVSLPERHLGKGLDRLPERLPERPLEHGNKKL